MSDPLPADGRDPPRREPIFSIPAVVVALIAALAGLYALYDLASPETQDSALRMFAFLPKRLTWAIWNEHPVNPFFRVDAAQPWTLVTYAFLHGSWMHVLLNSVWLVAFGPPVARRFGAARFLAFFAFTAIAGALAHWLVYPNDLGPLVGASAADSGLMAAVTRFIFEPGAPLGSPQGYSMSAGEVDALRPAPPLAQLLRERRALGFIAIWMATNFVFGAGAQTLGASDAPVAWIAHVGGFVAGLVAFPLFDPAPQAR